MAPILEVDHVGVQLVIKGQYRPVVNDVSLVLHEGEMVGLVDESGCGKSMTAKAITGLLPQPNRLEGEIRIADRRDRRERASEGELTSLERAATIAMISQDPRAHINPVRHIRDFATEALTTVQHVPRAEARRLVRESLVELGIGDAEWVLEQYPHQLSGGLLQRVMIASCLVVNPRIIIADEPTTALDVTTQSEVVAILEELKQERGLAVLFITHDIDLAASVCDRTIVMYAGRVMEEQPSPTLCEDPMHPYTAGLLRSRPSVEGSSARLTAIPGRPDSASEAPDGCPFAPRCEYVEEKCRQTRIEPRRLGSGLVACRRAEEIHELLGEGK